jgi:hypothetical protein
MDWYGRILIVGFVVVIVGYIYIYVVQDWLEYQKAKKEIFTFVKSYKRRCTGSNRFIVTVESLQDSFRAYNTTVITNVWLELVAEHVIEQDLQDQEWCVK